MEDKELTPFQKVALPLIDDEIEWKVQTCGKGDKGVWAKLTPYKTSRSVMTRFDEAFGPENWKDKYFPITVGGSDGFLCELSVRVNDEWITKVDGAPTTGIESIKGGISDALKRAATKWGMGRELYKCGTVWAYQPTEGYPPRDMPDAISIYSKDKGIQAWCRPPAIAIVLAQPEPPEPPKEKPKVVTQTFIEKILKLEKTAHSSVPEMDNSRENHKVSDKIEQTPYDVLFAYGVHLKAKIESKNR